MLHMVVVDVVVLLVLWFGVCVRLRVFVLFCGLCAYSFMLCVFFFCFVCRRLLFVAFGPCLCDLVCYACCVCVVIAFVCVCAHRIVLFRIWCFWFGYLLV